MNPPPLSNKQSGLPKGVYYTRSKKKFFVRVFRDGHVKCLGVYDTAEEASAVYVQFITDYPHGPMGPAASKRKPNAALAGTWLNGL